MSNRPPESLKTAATHLSSAIASGSSSNVNALLQQLSSYGKGKEAPVNREEALAGVAAEEGKIGIWKLKAEPGKKAVYERDKAYYNEWYLYANRHRIPAASERKRIVLIGESVARGYIYDPHYNPAMVLDTLLNADAGLGGVEVVDLAVSNNSILPTAKLISECVALQPAAIVIFAGNNWRYDLFNQLTPAELDQIAGMLEGGEGPAQTKGILEAAFEKMVVAFLKHVKRVAEPRGIPVVFVIPEYNLLDYHSTPTERVIPALPGDGVQRWVNARDAAQQALSRGDIEAAARHAGTMIQLDASNPLGFELMARCRLAQHNLEGARECLEVARDTAMYSRSDSQPRIYQVTRKTILKYAQRYGISVVDLVDVFAQHQPGRLPGRELFIDYCHLSVEGMHVAMAAAAARLLALLAGREVSPQVLQDKAVPPTDDVSGMAHCFAAMHNAHWGQGYDIVLHHCQQAVKFSAQPAQVMRMYAELATRHAPSNLCRALEQIMESGLVNQYYRSLMHPRNMKYMDLDLVNAMLEALRPTGTDLGAEVAGLREKEHGIAGQGNVDLLQSFYHATSYNEFLGKKTAFFQSRDTASQFFVVMEKSTALAVKLTYRVPVPVAGRQPVRVKVNDAEVAHLPVSQSWHTQEIELPAEHFSQGVNVIGIEWPCDVVVKTNHVRKGTSVQDLMNSAFQVFGEIHAFTACPAGQAA